MDQQVWAVFRIEWELVHKGLGSAAASEAADLLEADGVSAGSLGSNIDEAGPSGEKKVALDTKTRRRLEQLQEQEQDGKSVRLTQAELVARVDKLNGELKAMEVRIGVARNAVLRANMQPKSETGFRKGDGMFDSEDEYSEDD